MLHLNCINLLTMNLLSANSKDSPIDLSFRNGRIALSLIFFLYGTLFAAWASRIPDIKILHGLNDPQLGVVLLAMPVGTVLSLMISGRIIANYNIKLIITGSFILLNISIIGLGFPGSDMVLVSALFLFGFFGNALNVAINTQAIDVQKKLGRTIMSSFHAIYSVGFMLSIAVGGILSKLNVSAFSHYVILTGLNVLVIILIFRFLLNSESKTKEVKPGFGFITSDRNLWILGFIVFCGVLSEGTLIDWAAVYFRQTVSHSVKNSATALTLFSVAMTIGRFSGDYFVNRFKPTTVLILSGTGLFVGMLLALSTLIPSTVMLGYIITGLSIANIVPITYTLTERLSSKNTALAISTIATIGYIGILLGPALIGFLSAVVTLRGALFTIAFLGLVVLFLAIPVSRREKKI